MLHYEEYEREGARWCIDYEDGQLIGTERITDEEMLGQTDLDENGMFRSDDFCDEEEWKEEVEKTKREGKLVAKGTYDPWTREEV